MQVNLTTDQVIPTCEVERFIVECLQAVGASADHAHEQARVFIESDIKGQHGCGIRALREYICKIHEGIVDAYASPTVEKENDCTALVDGHNGIGAAIASFCIHLAIDKAKKSGIGWVCANNSNDIGTLDSYSQLAAEEGLVGLCFSNGPPVVVASGGRDPVLGKNPLSVTVPTEDAQIFSMHMATCTVQEDEIRDKRIRGEDIPAGWYVDASGSFIRDPESDVKGFLTPLGTTRATQGSKGTMLALLVEILCGVSSGSNFGPFVPADHTKPANLGHCFVVFDPNCFAPGFEKRMGRLLSSVKRSDPIDKNHPVCLPGEKDKERLRACQTDGGIRYSKCDIEVFAKLSATLGIDPVRNNHGVPATPMGAGGKICYAKCSTR